MIKSRTLACSALALSLGLFAAPAAQAMENAGMSKMSGDGMMPKGSMKKHKKHKDGMMGGDAMKSDGMSKGSDAAPAQ
jgi:pentapeptide MXKDX repeat protein